LPLSLVLVKSAVEDANESAQVAKSAVEAAQAAKSAVEDANETAQFTDDVIKTSVRLIPFPVSLPK
jgi:methyl-accepting chemotaxis protein